MSAPDIDAAAFWAARPVLAPGEPEGDAGVRAFWALRGAPLHRFGPADWDRYYPRMAPWLHHPDPAVRDAAVERLMMAAFRAEPDSRTDPATQARGRGRALWLLDAVERARDAHPDVLATFLRHLRWHGDDAPFRTVLLPWLRDLQPGDDGVAALIEGAAVMLGEVGDGGEAALLVLLDHRSDYVRACAAYQLGRTAFDDPGAFAPPFLAALTDRELRRPGIAGAFWSGWAVTDYAALPFDPLGWMLDIIERRGGPEPGGTGFNGLDFHVHELADHSPDGVRRLLRAGRADLAVMAATEVRGAVEAMRPVLRELAAHADVDVAHEATDHLARHYAEMAPGADPRRLRHVPSWRPRADLFVLRQGGDGAWHDVAVLYPAGELFDDAEADALIDAVLPPGRRGTLVRHPLAAADAAPGPVRAGDAELHAYASGARVERWGDVAMRRWRRLEVLGPQRAELPGTG